ncbi:DUF2635 domain-containing protein [Pseudomonas sp. WS 5071]|nr:DUF2635 domain-containing protein [Pseudomonas sp. WS 5071]NNA11376.1 DUF2635 domain-containing protein [Pseudomonas lundensis]OZY31106.1 DUF2635 domain-containing protein [Pseudomonas lundensis]
MYLKPAQGRDVPDPEKGGELLPETGAQVPHNAYWQRRINDGDAVESKPAKVGKAT